jgi:hypothetical protein
MWTLRSASPALPSIEDARSDVGREPAPDADGAPHGARLEPNEDGMPTEVRQLRADQAPFELLDDAMESGR